MSSLILRFLPPHVHGRYFRRVTCSVAFFGRQSSPRHFTVFGETGVIPFGPITQTDVYSYPTIPFILEEL